MKKNLALEKLNQGERILGTFFSQWECIGDGGHWTVWDGLCDY